MIIVIGSPLFVPGDGGEPSRAGGLPASIATAAAAAGRRVELVGRVGEDPAGEATLLALTRAGVGHVATLRDPTRPTQALAPPAPAPDDPLDQDSAAAGIEALLLDDESGTDDPTVRTAEGEGGTSLGPRGSATLDPGDLQLALRYLDGFSVVVVAEPLEPAGIAIAADGAAFAGAALLVLVPPDDDGRDAPATATVLEAPPSDLDGAFARTVGTLAAELDRGGDPAAALASAVASQGWQPAGD